MGRYVERSALSRADFARAVGTSRSRLSTYCTGSVTPSTALLLRMSQVGADSDGWSERRPRCGGRSVRKAPLAEHDEHGVDPAKKPGLL